MAEIAKFEKSSDPSHQIENRKNGRPKNEMMGKGKKKQNFLSKFSLKKKRKKKGGRRVWVGGVRGCMGFECELGWVW